VNNPATSAMSGVIGRSVLPLSRMFADLNGDGFPVF
jgi:hypothetical protein